MKGDILSTRPSGQDAAGHIVAADVLVLGEGAEVAVQALREAGLQAAVLPDPLHSLPGWAASHPAQPAPAVLPWLITTAVGTPGFSVECLSPAGRQTHTARALVAPLAARERLLPFPGHDLPGVGGIGMVPSHGARVLLVGPSPWVEAARARIAAARAIPVELQAPAHVLRVQAEDRSLRISLATEDRRALDMVAEHLMVADGWLPATDIFRLLRVAMVFDDAADAWLPATDAQGRCSQSFLYRLAADPVAQAACIAADLAAGVWAPELPRPETAAPRGGTLDRRVAALPDAAIICPCEAVTAGEVRALVAGGLREINQLKSATRCGMGPCGGRLCEDTAARVLASAQGCHRADVGYWSGRAPLVPVPLRALTGDYSYADIPIPAAAPL